MWLAGLRAFHADDTDAVRAAVHKLAEARQRSNSASVCKSRPEIDLLLRTELKRCSAGDNADVSELISLLRLEQVLGGGVPSEFPLAYPKRGIPNTNDTLWSASDSLGPALLQTPQESEFRPTGDLETAVFYRWQSRVEKKAKWHLFSTVIAELKKVPRPPARRSSTRTQSFW
jgi:hypothetical protein